MPPRAGSGSDPGAGSGAEKLHDQAPGAGPIVEVDADDLLPGAHEQLAVGEGHGHRGPHQCRSGVAVAIRVGVAVVVLPLVALGGDAIEDAIEVGDATGLVLHGGDGARGVRDEDGAEAVAEARVVHGLLCVGRDVENLSVARRGEGELLVYRLHPILPSGPYRPGIGRAARVYGPPRRPFTSESWVSVGPDLPVPVVLLGPLLEAAGDVLRSLDPVEVPLALRHLQGLDRRGLAHGRAPRQLSRAIATDERFRDRVVSLLLSRDAVRAVVSSWSAERAVEEAEAAAGRGDLPLLISALCAARPDGFAYGVGAAVAVASSARRAWGSDTGSRGIAERVEEIERGRRRAEADAMVLRAEVERSEALLRDERRARRAVEEQAESSAVAARARFEELESELRITSKTAERAEARAGRESIRLGERDAELRASRQELDLAREELATSSARSGARLGDHAPAERRARREAAEYPLGLVAGTADEVTAMVLDRAVVLVVDGYDVTRRAWSDAALSDQRARLARALAQAHLRGWCEATVVFDGAGAEEMPPLTRPGLRILFSADGETTDAVIAREVDRLVARGPVLVVSSDARVGGRAGAGGARVAPAAAFLEALGA